MLRKYAACEVLSTAMGTMPGQARTAHRVSFGYTPRPGYLYVRCRAISSRCNDNWDAFSPESIEGDHHKLGYCTFIGKPVFVNHHNSDHRKLRGVVIDAALHHDRNPDGSPDTWAEVLMEIDARTYPKLAKAIIAGKVDRTSMGVDVMRSTCSACDNIATKPSEYCEHIPKKKGKRLWAFNKQGAKKAVLIYEKCDGLTFFENSLLVEEPADPTAVVWGVDTRGLSATASAAGQAPAKRRVDPSIYENTKKFLPRMEDLYPVQPRTASRLRVVQGSACRACASLQTLACDGHQECFDCGHTQHLAVVDPDQLSIEAAPRYQSPDEHPWFQEHPVHENNIIDHWNRATEDEKDQGKRWYGDAHIVAKGIAKGDATKGAGMLAVYSPQSPWVTNMHNAARVLHENRARGGKGEGIMASASQKASAQRILDGEHYNDVFKGPKIRDFAHLIEHGGDEHPDVPHVVIDRHALGVAAGKGLTDEQYGKAPINGSPRKDGSINRTNYDHVVSKYHAAAKHISDHEDAPVAGHQVQAVTWLVRQRLNQQAERDRAKGGGDSRLDRGREKSRQKSQQDWEGFRSQNLPHFTPPGTGYQAKRKKLAYGETKAPPDVDTLREEECPVCGESSNAWDGNRCSVCGFSAPPRQFRDPDLQMARQVDMRKEIVDPTGTYQTDVGDFADEAQGLGDAVSDNEAAPDLVCDNCGATFAAAPAKTTDMDAEANPLSEEEPDEQDEPTDPMAEQQQGEEPEQDEQEPGEEDEMGEEPEAAEGDVCPDCGEGELVSPEQMEETTGEPTGIEPEEGDGRVDPSEFDDEDEDSDQEFGKGSDDESEPDDESDDKPDDESEEDDGDDKDEDDAGRPPAKSKGKPFGKG